MFEHVLVPLDGSRLAECALPHAVAVAQAFGSRITLLQALERVLSASPSQTVDPLNWHIRKVEADAYLDKSIARLQRLGLQAEKRLLEGQAAEQIVEFARGHDVKLIIFSSHGRSGLSGWNISSVVQKSISQAYVPVMIVRAYQPYTSDLSGLRYQRLLVPLDGSMRAECVLPLATTLARSHESQLLLVHIVRKPEMPRRAPLTQQELDLIAQISERNRLEAAKSLEQLRSQLPANVETRMLTSDDITGTLHDLVEHEGIDLVVLSAHGYSGRNKWPYGSVALSFIAYGTTPLLIVQDISPDKTERTQAELAAREYKGH